MTGSRTNAFLVGSLGAIYVRTALPIIMVMGMNGLLAVVDALFLGHFVGPEALAAVTLMFPLYMLVVALATLVSSGMSSILARHLGGQQFAEARQVFAGAHGLALAVSAVLVVLFLLFGPTVTALASGGDANLASMGLTYLRITVLTSPLIFVLSVNSDALRNEGRVGFMASMSLLVSLANIGFNYILIAQLGLGVAGSALGTALAQALAFAIILTFRVRGETELRPAALTGRALGARWSHIMALGAPQSLGFVGLALSSAAVMLMLQVINSANYADTVSAYGIITRVMTFAYLPLLGLSYAMQTVTGNNHGAGMFDRSNSSLRIGIVTAFVYCGVLQILMMTAAGPIGGLFVSDRLVIAEVARILPIVVLAYCVAGPLMMIASHFQAIGDARRAALLSLSRPYLLGIPLTLALPLLMGEPGIWQAGPLGEGMWLLLTALVLFFASRQGVRRWGLFERPGAISVTP